MAVAQAAGGDTSSLQTKLTEEQYVALVLSFFFTLLMPYFFYQNEARQEYCDRQEERWCCFQGSCIRMDFLCLIFSAYGIELIRKSSLRL